MGDAGPPWQASGEKEGTWRQITRCYVTYALAKAAWVSLLVLAEATWVLASVYERSRTDIATVVDMFLNHRDLTIQDPDVVSAALADFGRKPAVGFSDCLVLEIARKAGHLPLGTFDANLSTLAGAERL